MATQLGASIKFAGPFQNALHTSVPAALYFKTAISGLDDVFVTAAATKQLPEPSAATATP